jgi:hypothetical protein
MDTGLKKPLSRAGILQRQWGAMVRRPLRTAMLGWLTLLVWLMPMPMSPTITWAAPSINADAPTATELSPANSEAETAPANPKPDADDIPSDMVSRFVAAYLAVVELIESQEASLQRAETDTESRQLQQEIQAQAIGLIQDQGLSLQSYWELLGLANSDPEFRERVLAQVEEASL